jgi:hypothetical protein
MSLNSLDSEQLLSSIRDLLERGPDGQSVALNTAHDQLESFPAAAGDEHVESALELMGTALGRNSTRHLSSHAMSPANLCVQKGGKCLSKKLGFWTMSWIDLAIQSLPVD